MTFSVEHNQQDGERRKFTDLRNVHVPKFLFERVSDFDQWTAACFPARRVSYLPGPGGTPGKRTIPTKKGPTARSFVTSPNTKDRTFGPWIVTEMLPQAFRLG